MKLTQEYYFLSEMLHNADGLCKRLQDDYDGTKPFEQDENDRSTMYDVCELLTQVMHEFNDAPVPDIPTQMWDEIITELRKCDTVLPDMVPSEVIRYIRRDYPEWYSRLLKKYHVA